MLRWNGDLPSHVHLTRHWLVLIWAVMWLVETLHLVCRREIRGLLFYMQWSTSF